MNRRSMTFGILALGLFASSANAAMEIYTGILDGVGAGGFDVVNYFTANAAAKGKPEFMAEYKEAKWYFVSAENLAQFKASPEKFAPQYGGHCAYALSKGALAKGDPEIYTIVEGKLYLNLSAGAKKLWSEDIPGNIALADKNWPAILK